MKFSIAGLIVSIIWAWFFSATMKVQGAGTASAILYILVFPLQLALISASLNENFQLYSLDTQGKIALSVLPLFLSIILPALSFLGHLTPALGDSSFRIVVFGPSLTLISLAAMALLSQLMPQALQVLNSTAAMSSMVIIVIIASALAFDKSFLLARGKFDETQGLEKLAQFHQGYARQLHFRIRESLAALVQNREQNPIFDHMRFDQTQNVLIVARRFHLKQPQDTQSQLAKTATIHPLETTTVNPQSMIEWRIPLADIKAEDLVKQLQDIANFEPRP